MRVPQEDGSEGMSFIQRSIRLLGELRQTDKKKKVKRPDKDERPSKDTEKTLWTSPIDFFKSTMEDR